MPKACRRDRGLCLRNACYMHARTLWPRTPAHQTPCFRHVYAHMYASRQISAPVSLPPLPPSPSVFPQACSFGCVHAGAAGHAGVTADLQVPGWAARCLLARGFDPRAPTAWVLEGLLYYLQPSTVPVLLQVRHVGGACSGAAAGAACGGRMQRCCCRCGIWGMAGCGFCPAWRMCAFLQAHAFRGTRSHAVLACTACLMHDLWTLFKATPCAAPCPAPWFGKLMSAGHGRPMLLGLIVVLLSSAQ